jgi:hypothetical protein
MLVWCNWRRIEADGIEGEGKGFEPQAGEWEWDSISIGDHGRRRGSRAIQDTICLNVGLQVLHRYVFHHVTPIYPRRSRSAP